MLSTPYPYLKSFFVLIFVHIPVFIDSFIFRKHQPRPNIILIILLLIIILTTLIIIFFIILTIIMERMPGKGGLQKRYNFWMVQGRQGV